MTQGHGDGLRRVSQHRASNFWGSSVAGGFGGAAWVPPSGSLTVEEVEWHGRIEQDWYAATALVDLLSFIYVAVFYQVTLLCHVISSRLVWQLI